MTMIPASWSRFLIAGAAGALVFAGFGVVAEPAHADFAVYPSRLEVSAKQGETVTFEINVSTPSAEHPMQVAVSAWDFARDSTGEPQPISAEDAERFHGCSSWLTWFPSSAEVEPGGERAFMLTAEVPADVEDGTHYCYVTFSAMPQLPAAELPESGQAMRTPLGYAVSALVLISVGEGPDAPTLRADARVDDFGVKTFNLNEAIPMSVKLVNSGNVHLNMNESSKIGITKGKYTEADIPLQSFTLLPDNTLVIPVEWVPESVGIYKAMFYTDVGLSEPITAERVFFVLSWPLIIGIVSGVVLIILGAWLFFGRYKIRFTRKGVEEPAPAAAKD
jgi:hypothetical protein